MPLAQQNPHREMLAQKRLTQLTKFPPSHQIPEAS